MLGMSPKPENPRYPVCSRPNPGDIISAPLAGVWVWALDYLRVHGRGETAKAEAEEEAEKYCVSGV